MLVLPLLNIRQSELVLRSDVVFLLGQIGLTPELLLFRDQLNLRALQRAGRLRLTLVDHNVLPRLATPTSNSTHTHTRKSQIALLVPKEEEWCATVLSEPVSPV